MSDDPYRVIVFDDDPEIADFVRMVLERRAGCLVRAYNDPAVVASVVEEFRPDVVITDIEMPGMSGLDLIGRVRSVMPGLPVIVMTAHVSVQYAVRALRSQADEFVTKPFVTTELTATVLSLAARWRSTLDTAQDQQRAIEVQRSLLPSTALALDGFALEGGCLPARAVGGDFFDWYPVERGAALTLADVMGKGMGAAIIAASVRAVMRSRGQGADLGAALGDVDAALTADLEQSGAFVTLFHGVLDTTEAVLRYADAGHGLTIQVRASGGFERLTTSSLPLGSGLGGGWREHSLAFEPGDMLVSVSDGVLDLYDGTLDSMRSVEEVVRASATAAQVVDVLLDKARAEGAPDDVTVVALHRL